MKFLRGRLKIDNDRLGELEALEHLAKTAVPYKRGRLGRVATALRCIVNGLTPPKIEEVHGISASTVRSWVIGFNLKGIEGVSGERSGRPCKLTREQWFEVAETIQETPHKIRGRESQITAKNVAAFIRREYPDVKAITERTVRNNLANL